MKPLSIFLTFYVCLGACFKSSHLFTPCSAALVVVAIVAAGAVVIWEIQWADRRNDL